jgi:plasmid replication initiation protein
MSALQRKLFNVLIYEAKKNTLSPVNDNSVCVECRVPFSKISELINFKSNNIQYLKEAIDGLASLKIEWNLLKDKVPSGISFLNLRVMHGPPTFYHDGTFNFSFHKVMLDLLDNPSIYGTIDLDIQSKYESKYSHALYENCTRLVNLQKEKIISLDIFRKMLGVPESKYLTMRELTRNVIRPSLEEVNDKADFRIDLESMKVGSKIIGFKIAAVNKITDVSSLKSKKTLVNIINETFGELRQAILIDILKNYSEAYILEKIEYTKKYARRESSGLHPIRYFISALKGDYVSNNTLSKIILGDGNDSDISKWIENLKTLKSNAEHWERMLAKAEIENNEYNIQTIREIHTKSKAELEKHYLQRPEE